jgi:deazaflavin-dependent oxidoreductase (nitroreductase family)
MSLREPLMPAWLPPVMTRVVNPVQRLWAPRLPPWALVVHRGRRSGTEYRTPVLALTSGDDLVVVLFYGARTQWIRNLEAGGGAVVRAGRRRAITGVRVVRAPEPGLPSLARRALARGIPLLVLQRA